MSHVAQGESVVRPQILKIIGIALVAACAAVAAPVNLVVNGEFENPVITDNGGDFQRFDDPLSVPSWSDDDPDVGIELWREGYLGAPPLGSDGNPTGQHMELIARNTGTIISQSFLVPFLATAQAIFEFDAWQRGVNNSGVYSIVGSMSGTLVDQAAIIASTSAWILNQQILTISPGEMITISFAGLGASDRSPHIDQVEFIIDAVGSVGPQPIPEPSGLALLAAGFVALAALRHKRRLAP